ncbi:DUF4358 domain-containing protein [Lachnospiraceae bacterium 62-35]
MKRNDIINQSIAGARRGLLLLAAAMVLGGCGSSEGKEAEAAAVESSVEAEPETSAEVGTEEVENEAGETASADSSQKEADPRGIYESIGEAVELPSMMEGDDSFISNYYGINPADLESYVFASAEDATLADAIIIMEVKSQEAQENIVNALNTVIEQKCAEMENYLPEQFEIVAKSSVKTEGLYVYLVISKDAEKMEEVIQSALK